MGRVLHVRGGACIGEPKPCLTRDATGFVDQPLLHAPCSSLRRCPSLAAAGRETSGASPRLMAELLRHEGPRALNEAIEDLVGNSNLKGLFLYARDALVIDDEVAENHAAKHLRVQADAIEPLRGVELCKRRLTDDSWLSRRRAKYPNGVAVLGHKAIEVTRVVCSELTLYDGLGIQLSSPYVAAGLPFFRRDGPDFSREPRMGGRVNRSVLDLGTCWILAKIVIAFPVLRRSDGSRHKTTPAVGADVAQYGIDTGSAERTFISTDARLK